MQIGSGCSVARRRFQSPTKVQIPGIGWPQWYRSCQFDVWMCVFEQCVQCKQAHDSPVRNKYLRKIVTFSKVKVEKLCKLPMALFCHQFLEGAHQVKSVARSKHAMKTHPQLCTKEYSHSPPVQRKTMCISFQGRTHRILSFSGFLMLVTGKMLDITLTIREFLRLSWLNSPYGA